MAVKYKPRNWVDRIEDYVTGEVLREGTDYCAINMNHIEQGIAQLWNGMETIGGIVQRDLEIPAQGWSSLEGLPDDQALFDENTICVDVEVDGCTEELIPVLLIDPSSQHEAALCRMKNVVRSLEGKLRIFSRLAPREALKAQVLLISSGEGLPSFDYMYSTMPVASKERLGGVMIGDNIDVDERGLISTDIDAQIDDQIATDQEVEALMKELFNKE